MDSRDGGGGYVVHDGCDHIFFIGFLGAGKSTLARNLGQLFHRRYVDTDRLVERMVGKSVRRIFAEDGESSFREDEQRALEKLEGQKSLLVSCGGGIVESERSCELMRDMGFVVFLDGDLDDSLRQIQHPELRPDLSEGHQCEELYLHRRPLYERCADCSIDIRMKSFEQVAGEAASLLWEKGLL